MRQLREVLHRRRGFRAGPGRRVRRSARCCWPGARSSQTSLFFSASRRLTVSKAVGGFPDGVVLHAEEERAVAGIFRIDVDLAGEERRPHHLRRTELDATLDGNALSLEHERDHLPEEAALGVDFRGDDDLVAGLRRRSRRCREGDEAAAAARPAKAGSKRARSQPGLVRDVLPSGSGANPGAKGWSLTQLAWGPRVKLRHEDCHNPVFARRHGGCRSGHVDDRCETTLLLRTASLAFGWAKRPTMTWRRGQSATEGKAVTESMTSGNDFNGLRVLVVEDEAAISLLLEDMLLDFGCEVIGPAARLTAALDAVHRENDRSRDPRRERGRRTDLSGRRRPRRAVDPVRFLHRLRQRRDQGHLP